MSLGVCYTIRLSHLHKPISILMCLFCVYQDAGMTGVQQDMAMKVLPNRIGAQPSHLSINQQLPPGIQRQTNGEKIIHLIFSLEMTFIRR